MHNNIINFNKCQKGVTLVELLIAMTIMTAIVSLASSFIFQGVKFSRLTETRGEIQRNVRESIDLINRNIREAVSETIIIGRFDNTQPPCSLIEFTSIEEVSFRFYQKNNVLIMQRQTTSAAWSTISEKIIARDLRILLFAYPRTNDDTIVSVSICFEKGIYLGITKALQLSVEKIRVMN